LHGNFSRGVRHRTERDSNIRNNVMLILPYRMIPDDTRHMNKEFFRQAHCDATKPLHVAWALIDAQKRNFFRVSCCCIAL
jgi:hypothetical protein